jgi:hypothetical protein
MIRSTSAAVLLGLSAVAGAQVMEDVELRREGQDAVASIRFVTPIQFRRAVSARAGDLTQAFYDVMPATDLPSLVDGRQRVAGGGGLPQIVILDEVVDRAGMGRKLLVRFNTPTRFKVRAGRGNKSIEIVLEGLGDAVSSSIPPVPAPAVQPAVLQQPQSVSAATDINAKAVQLLAAAQAAFDRADHAVVQERLNELLALPPNESSRKAQELIGVSRLKAGDPVRARSEFELFLKLYPAGEDSDRVRQLLATVPAAAKVTAAKPVVQPVATWSGSLSAFYYGGQSKVRTQEFLDSPISGLPQLQSESTLSGTDQSQVQTSADLNWRYRDAETDMRFVARDAYSVDLRTNGVNKNRLSALYFDHRSLVNGTSIRVGRQSPNGGGVLYRFDGVQAGYTFAPKWKVNAMAGAPTDTLLDTRRRIYGAWIDAEALTKEISGNFYINQQVIDGEVDRRAIGTELRYFSGGLSASAQLDYDLILRDTNIASVQATWQLPDTTVFNFLYDRRTTPILSLGNILFFQDPNLITPARRIQDLLGTTPLSILRDQVKGTTAYQTQAMVGVTTPIAKNWQVGGDIRLTNVGEIKPVAVIFPSGSPSTGNLWGLGMQLIGSNLYSSRDTHVFNASFLKGPTYHGTLLSYNNLSSLNDKWQVEPSLKYYRQSDTTGTSSTRWTPGFRVTYRVLQKVSLESELSYEMSKTTSPSRSESSHRMFYYLGARYDF